MVCVAVKQHTAERNADEDDRDAEFCPTRIDNWVGEAGVKSDSTLEMTIQIRIHFKAQGTAWPQTVKTCTRSGHFLIMYNVSSTWIN